MADAGPEYPGGFITEPERMLLMPDRIGWRHRLLSERARALLGDGNCDADLEPEDLAEIAAR